MFGQKRISDYGFQIGKLRSGPLNAITDVPGVKLAHCSVVGDGINTGVTAILPHTGNLFIEKLWAATHIANGFGKSVGTMQVDEMGTIETPIMLTNTLSVGSVSTALLQYMLNQNPDIDMKDGTINPLVFECNDGYLNDIRGMHVQHEHVVQALESASEEFLEGAVGAGTGMSCYQLKGGIGTASRVFSIADESYVLGALVLSNMGQLEDFVLQGRTLGREIKEKESLISNEADKGSIIIIIACNAPLDPRQLKRICKRSFIGVSRTGNVIHNGSGEIALAFSTAHRVPHMPDGSTIKLSILHEKYIDLIFHAAIDACEEAVLNSMITASSMSGFQGRSREGLASYLAPC